MVELVIARMLVVPNQFTGVGIECYGAVGIECVVVFILIVWAKPQNFGVICRSGTEVNQIQFGIEAAGYPYRTSSALIQRQIIPGITTGFAGTGNRPKTPYFFAAFHVHSENKVTTFYGLPAGQSYNCFAISYYGRALEPVSVFITDINLVVP